MMVDYLRQLLLLFVYLFPFSFCPALKVMSKVLHLSQNVAISYLLSETQTVMAYKLISGIEWPWLKSIFYICMREL